MRILACLVLVVVACGGPDELLPAGPDASIDAVEPDPFAGMFDSPDDFPRAGCVPGAMAGFAQVDLWPALDLRTEVVAGELRTYYSPYTDDVIAPHQLDADDLLVRVVVPQYRELVSYDLCNVDPDGTLYGTTARCNVFSDGPDCFVGPVVAHPFRRGPGEGDGLHLTLVGETDGSTWPGITANVRVDGDLAYLAREEDGLRVVGIADESHPVELGHFVIPGEDYYNDVKLLDAGGRRYVIAASNTTRVIDVTTPSGPWLAADIPFSAHTVFLEGTTAYLATGGGGEVSAYDLSNPRAPRYLGGYDGVHSVHDLYVEGGIAYLSATDQGMVVVDFRDPTAPVELGREAVGTDFRYWHSPWLTHVGGKPVIVHGDEGRGTLLRLLDGDPASPTFLHTLGQWASRPDVSIHNLMAFGERAYAAHYRDGVRIFDLHDPTAPALIGYYNTWRLGTPKASPWTGAFGIDVDRARRRIYVADAQRGLMILAGDATVFP